MGWFTTNAVGLVAVLFFVESAQAPRWRLLTGTAGKIVTGMDVYARDPDTVYIKLVTQHSVGRWFVAK